MTRNPKENVALASPQPSGAIGTVGGLHDIIRQVRADFAAAHGEICKLQGLDPNTHTWPEWSSIANTLRWFDELSAAPVGPVAVSDEMVDTACEYLKEDLDPRCIFRKTVVRAALEAALSAPIAPAMQPPSGETIRATKDGSMEAVPLTGQSPVGTASSVIAVSAEMVERALHQYHATAHEDQGLHGFDERKAMRAALEAVSASPSIEGVGVKALDMVIEQAAHVELGMACRGVDVSDAVRELLRRIAALTFAASPQAEAPTALDVVSRADVLRICKELGAIELDYVLEGLPENARTREAAEAMSVRIRTAVAIMPSSVPPAQAEALESARKVLEAFANGNLDVSETAIILGYHTAQEVLLAARSALLSISQAKLEGDAGK